MTFLSSFSKGFNNISFFIMIGLLGVRPTLCPTKFTRMAVTGSLFVVGGWAFHEWDFFMFGYSTYVLISSLSIIIWSRGKSKIIQTLPLMKYKHFWEFWDILNTHYYFWTKRKNEDYFGFLLLNTKKIIAALSFSSENMSPNTTLR